MKEGFGGKKDMRWDCQLQRAEMLAMGERARGGLLLVPPPSPSPALLRCVLVMGAAVETYKGNNCYYYALIVVIQRGNQIRGVEM